MEQLVTFAVRLGLGLGLGVMLRLLGLALAMLAIPPIKAGEDGYLLIRVALIGTGAGTAAAVGWSLWRARSRDSYVSLTLALIGGVVGALGSYTWVDAHFDGLSALDQALLSGRTTVVSAVVGANLPPAVYSAVLLILNLAGKRR